MISENFSLLSNQDVKKLYEQLLQRQAKLPNNKTMSRNPEIYAELILENVRGQFGNNEITIDQVKEMLNHSEAKLAESRFGKFDGEFSGNIYAVKNEYN